MKNFSRLPKETQNYINDRYGTYGIDGEDAFNSFPDELKDLPPEKIEEFLKMKHISHINPRSKFPNQEDELKNTILEDPDLNIIRRDNIMTKAEMNNAEIDNINDIESLSLTIEGVEETGFLDIVGASIAGGIPVLSAIDVGDKVLKGEVSADDVVPYYINNHGKKTLTYLLIGGALASSSAFIVSAGVGAMVYKNKSLFKRGFDSVDSKTKEDIKDIANQTVDIVTAPFRFTYYLVRGVFIFLFVIAIIWAAYHSAFDWDLKKDFDFTSVFGFFHAIIGMSSRIVIVLFALIVIFVIFTEPFDKSDDVLDKYKR